VAGLAVQILNGVVLPVVAVADKRMDGGVGDAVIVTVGIGAGLAMRVNPLRVFRLRRLFRCA
jgi:hypothetical protein